MAAVDLVEASTVDTMILDKLAPNVNGSNSLILELKKKKNKKSKKPNKRMKKPPDAPKRFKSSFIFFSMEKHKEIKEELSKGAVTKTTNITSLVSEAWRELDPLEKQKFEEMAKQDKARYDIEKSKYVPPPGVFLDSKRKRDPDAPKRPMSAYFSFANKIRGKIKSENPNCSNGEISKILSAMWKEIPEDERKEYKDNEQSLWGTYRQKMTEWKKKNDGRKKEKKSLDLLRQCQSKRGEDSKKKLDHANIGSMDFSSHAVVDTDVGVDEQLRAEQLLCLGVPGIDTNPNTDEMMAASALRGVRGGPQQHMGAGMGDPSHNNGYSAFFGVDTTNGMNPMLGGTQVSGQATIGQIDMPGFPYNQYNYHLGGNTAMIMAQLRGAPPQQQYPGFMPMDQQANLSQLASLAGVQNDATQQQHRQDHLQEPIDQSVSENGIDIGIGNRMRNGNMGNNVGNDNPNGNIAF